MDLLSYFGKLIPIGEKVTITGYQFNYMMTLGIAACVIFLGHWMVRHSKFLQKYCIPAPVVAGLVVSIILSIVRGMHIVNITFDMTNIQDLSQNIFFMCVGYGFSAKLLKKAGGKLTAMIAIAACLLITLQNVVGLVVGHFIGLDPLLSLLCSSASMSGGVGTAGAFGPIWEAMGAQDATTVGVAAGTLGNVMGSLIGCPVAVYLIRKHNLKSDPNDKPERELLTAKPEIVNSRMITSWGLILLIVAFGLPFYLIFDNIPMIEMPKFIGCLFAGAIVRNIIEAMGKDTYTAEFDAQEHMWLELYLALTLMKIDFIKLLPVAGKMGIILLAQALLIVLFGIFVSFNMFGRDYGAAVMTAGNIGWGCGAGSNAVANEKAIMDEYGWHNIAWVLYPSFAVIIDDIYNPIFLSIAGSLVNNLR